MVAKTIVVLDKTYICIDDMLYVVDTRDFVALSCTHKNFLKNYDIVSLMPYKNINHVPEELTGEINILFSLPIGTEERIGGFNSFAAIWYWLKSKITSETGDCNMRGWVILPDSAA